MNAINFFLSTILLFVFITESINALNGIKFEKIELLLTF